MTDPFNDEKWKRLDDAHLDRDLRLMIQAYRDSGQFLDFNEFHRKFEKWALAAGMSKKGAKAKATLQVLRLKELLASESN
jgi:hypothetical protein